MALTDLTILSSTRINNNSPLEVAPCNITQGLREDFPEGIPTNMEVRKHFLSVSERDLETERLSKYTFRDLLYKRSVLEQGNSKFFPIGRLKCFHNN